MEDYIAIICEGEAEKAIMDILLESGSLIYEKADLLDEEVMFRCKAKVFESQYLNRNFRGRKVHVVRIHDSVKEKFKISKTYASKIAGIDSYITRPEIEMLIILAENKYVDYKNKYIRTMKPGDYCKQVLRFRGVKKYDFVLDYFKDVNRLIETLRKYERVKNDSYRCIYDLVKESMKK